MFSSIGKPGGGGGLLAPGIGGDGAAYPSITLKSVMKKIKNLHTIVFIIIERKNKIANFCSIISQKSS
jgi:hypothetical protein